MSCYRPLHLFNPVKNPSLRDRIYIDVPCGTCEDCRKRQRHDWYVRCFFQWLETKDVHNGITLYVTLTYRNDTLPFYNHIPCFDKKDIQDFLKRFRITLQRQFNVGLKNVKYFICSEYGEKGRPHYHGLIFIPRPCSPSDVYRIKNIVRSTWQNGFVNFGRKLANIQTAGLVQSPAALSYVCKYISKDMYFPFDKVVDSAQRPFHLQSQHFGEYMVEYYGLKSNSQFAINTLIDGSVLIGTEFKYPYAIPQYITRKCLYDYHYNLHVEETVLSGGHVVVQKRPEISYTLNELGRKVRLEQEFHSIEYQVSEFDRIFNNIESICRDMESENYVLSHCVQKFQFFDSLVSFVNFHYTCLDYKDRMNLALYCRVFKDRLVVPNAAYFYGVEDPEQCTLDNWQIYLQDIYNNDYFIKDIKQYNFDDDFKDKFGTHNFRNYLYSQTYAHSLNPDLQDTFEVLLSIFNSLTYILGVIDEEKALAKLKDDYNSKLLTKEVI